MEKQKPGIKRACEYLNKLKQVHGASRLPPIRTLARAAEVSFVTMWKALQFLQNSGSIVSDSRGNRKFSAEDQNTKENCSDTPTNHLYKPVVLSRTGLKNHVTDKLYRDIMTGRFSVSDKLPSCKELQQFYKVSFATLKKSLDTLVEEQILERSASGYQIPSLPGSTSYARIVVIGCGWEDGKIWVDHQDKSYFRTLESECIRMNVQLDVVVYYRYNDRLRFVHTASRKDYDLSDRSILGYIFIVANIDSAPEEVLEKLAGLKRDIAVLDVVGGWKIPKCARNRYIRFFTATASEQPAKRVAQYLLGKGHRQIAFISPFHKALWSQRRFETISEVFNRAGINGGVIPFVQNKYAYQWDYLKNAVNQENDLRSLFDQYTRWEKEAHGAIFKRFGNFGYNIVKYITEWNCASGEIYEKMEPLFEKALQNKSITAWAMANDFSAAIAIDYLKGHSLRVPEDMSVISFDNTLDAMEYQLTSYDFNNQGIITLILRFILSPHTFKSGSENRFIGIDGNLVIRRSC